MANHCIDVICSGCGRQYCLRGCGTDFEMGKAYFKEWFEKEKKKDGRNPFEFDSSKGDCCRDKAVYGYR